MFCPNCGNNVRDDSNFCEKCGIPPKNHRSRTQPSLTTRTWNRCKSIVHDYYGENKPGFFIIVALLLVMLGAIAYLGYSIMAPRGFVVTLQRITKEEKLDVYSKATLKVYCREFARDCSERGYKEIEKNIKLVLPMILLAVDTMDAKITYKNNTSSPISVKRFLYRAAPGPWKTDDSQTRYEPKLKRLRSAIEMAGGNVPFAAKVDYAETLALTENNGSFTILPGEEKMWRLGYNEKSEFQLEYIQNGKLYRTPVLRVR